MYTLIKSINHQEFSAEGRYRHGKTWVCAMAQSLWKVGSSSTGILQGKWENITWGIAEVIPKSGYLQFSNRKIVLECPIFREKTRYGSYK